MANATNRMMRAGLPIEPVNPLGPIFFLGYIGLASPIAGNRPQEGLGRSRESAGKHIARPRRRQHDQPHTNAEKVATCHQRWLPASAGRMIAFLVHQPSIGSARSLPFLTDAELNVIKGCCVLAVTRNLIKGMLRAS